MPYTGDAEHTMLEALTASHVGVGTKATAVTGWTGSGTIFTHAGHGYVDKDLVVCNSFTGGSALVAKRIYYVKKVGVNEIELFDKYALTGTAVSAASVTEASFSKITEASAGSPEYKRKAATFAAAANRKRKMTTEPELDVKAGTVVNVILICSAETGADKVIGIDPEVTEETFNQQGVAKVKEATLDLTNSP